ncbi:MAG: pyruvate kinase [Candidatus Nealsonbacteria bacterium]|nr:pyruvate kinase [Candidatus Nealsonbacteria bacterium]
MSLTKIVATVGPAVEKTSELVSLIKAGANIFRFNLKHNATQWHSQLIKKTKEASKITGQPISILLDFPDPDIKTFLPAFLEKNLSLAARHSVDFLALSFVRSKKDIDLLRNQTKKLSLSAKILAKIETSQSLENFEEILDSSDGIMIARGDLGMEIPFEQVPYYQKKIIKECIEKGKPVITATHMLESMIYNSLPNRAEVSDVANAILDYTDAVMLSAETATGKYPSKAVSVMERICRFWEKKRPPVGGFNFELNHQTAAVCYSAYQLWMSPFCQKENVKAFVVITETGMTARMISRLRPNLPILALTEDRNLRDQLCLSYGVTPLLFEGERVGLYKKRNFSDIEKILTYIKKTGYVKKREKVIIIYAEDWGTPGKTSIVRIQEVP